MPAVAGLSRIVGLRARPRYAASYMPGVAAAPYTVTGPVKLVADYYGPLMQLVRASDSATLDVWPGRVTPTGAYVPNYDAIDAWAGGSAVTVAILYDQTGNGRHDTQTVAANRPGFSPLSSYNGIRPIQFDQQRAGTSGPFKFFDTALAGVDRANFAMHMVSAHITSRNQRALFDGGTSMSVSQATSGWVSQGTSPTAATRYPTPQRRARVGLQAWSHNSNASARLFKVDGVDRGNMTAATSNTMTAGKEGAADFSALYFSTHDRISKIVFNTSMSSSDLDALDAWGARTFGFTTPTRKRLVLEGDSLIEGYFATNNRNTARLLSLSPTPLNTNEWEIINMAVAGATMATDAGTSNAGYNTDFVPYIDGALDKCVLVVQRGTNDFQGSGQASVGQTAARAYADNFYDNLWLPFINGTGFAAFPQRVACTIFARGTYDTGDIFYVRDQFNIRVRAGASANGYTVADLAADSRLSNYADTTYFNPDTIHLTDAGYQVMAQIISAAVLSV